MLAAPGQFHNVFLNIQKQLCLLSPQVNVAILPLVK